MSTAGEERYRAGVMVSHLCRRAVWGLFAAAAIACDSFGSASDGSTGDGGAPPGDASLLPDGAPAAALPDGAPCSVGSTPATFVKTAGPPGNLATDGSSIYWIESGSKIRRAPRATCAATLVAEAPAITAMAVNSSWLVWGQPSYRGIETAKIGSGAPPAEGQTQLDPSVTIRADRLAWIDSFSAVGGCVSPCGATFRWSQDVIVSAKLLAANATTLFFVGATQSITAESIWARTLTDPDVVGPIAGVSSLKLLAASASRVFWLDTVGTLRSVAPQVNAEPITISSVPGADSARFLAATGTFVYVASATAIQRVPAGGGPLAPVVSEQRDISSMLLVDDELYWASAADAAIYRMKPN